MVELRNVYFFPVEVVMALEASRAQSTVVDILMAGDATRGNSKESLIQILDLDRPALSGGDAFGVMASIALESRVLAFGCIRSACGRRF